jgi:hypothetical protein
MIKNTLVLTVLSAVMALLLWMHHQRITSAQITCLEILRAIDAGTQNWAIQHRVESNAVPTWSDIRPYLPQDMKPKCPQGGSYTLGSACTAPRCSISEHNLDHGVIRVVDEAGTPLDGVRVQVVGVVSTEETGSTGVARISTASRAAREISVSKSGYVERRIPIPDNWPLVVILGRQHANVEP